MEDIKDTEIRVIKAEHKNKKNRGNALWIIIGLLIIVGIVLFFILK